MRSRLIAAAVAAIAVGILTMHGLGTAGTASDRDQGSPRADAQYGPSGLSTAPHQSSTVHAAHARHNPDPPVASADRSVAPAVPRPDPEDHGGLHGVLGTCLWIVATAAAIRAAVRSGHLRRTAAAICCALRAAGAVLIDAGPAPPRLVPTWLVVSRR